MSGRTWFENELSYHWDVIPDNVVVSSLGVEPRSETADVTDGVGTPPRSSNGGESDERWGGEGSVVEQGGVCDFGNRGMKLEVTMSAVTACVDSLKRI